MLLVNIDPDLEPNMSSAVGLYLRTIEYSLLKPNTTITQIGGFMETFYWVYNKVYRLSQEVAIGAYTEPLERGLTLCAYVE